jgi:glycosyltransferase involved in cell wall biosynthesis
MSASEPLVSVCMPLYNTEDFLQVAIEGILGQSYQNLELIICDNGSTDSSVEIAHRFADSDARVQLLQNRRNIGYAGNLHKVTSLAKGEFMIVHCADDLAEPTALERMVDLATRPDVDRTNVIVLTDSFVADRSGRSTGVHRQAPEGFDIAYCTLDAYAGSGEVRRFKGKEALAFSLPRLSIVGWLGATLYSRATLESIEGVYNGLLYSPDLQFNYHLLSRDPDVLWVEAPLFSWRLHESGQIGQAQAQAVPKYAWDGYTYTFHFPEDLLRELGVPRAKIIHTFVDKLCLRRALAEIKHGSFVLAFRHLCIALATYPLPAIRNAKFWIAWVGLLLGPIGRVLAKLGYAAGVWRRRIPEHVPNSSPGRVTQ